MQALTSPGPAVHSASEAVALAMATEGGKGQGRHAFLCFLEESFGMYPAEGSNVTNTGLGRHTGWPSSRCQRAQWSGASFLTAAQK